MRCLNPRSFAFIFSALGLMGGLALLDPMMHVAIAADEAAATPAPAATAPAPAADTAKANDDDDDDAAAPDKMKTPEQKMQARFPQPIRVGDLVGQPILDGDHATIGYVRRVVRTADGKVKLIVPYRAWFAWATFLGDYDARTVAVPLEAVGSMGPALSSIDMDRDSYGEAPTWVSGTDKDIPPGDVIQIGLARE